MRRAVPAILLAFVLVCAVFAAAARSAPELVLFDAPRGAWLGALREGAPLVVLEERDGWRRVRLEGWTMGPGAGASGSAQPEIVGPDTTGAHGSGGGDRGDAQETAVPAAATHSAPRTAVIQGVLTPPLGTGGAAGAGILVLLVAEGGSLDTDHRKLGTECRTRLDQKDRDLSTLRAQAEHALSSSDNFREASARNDQARVRLATGVRERRELIQECRTRAQALFEQAVTARAISDASGRFEFQGIAPGRYRVVAFEATGETPRSWSFSILVDGSAPRVLDPSADRSPVSADWDLK